MKYFIVEWEHIKPNVLVKALAENRVEPIHLCDDREMIVCSHKPSGADIKELVWNLNNGAFCQVNECDYEHVEEFL